MNIVTHMKTINEVLEFLHLKNQTVEPFKGENKKYYYTYLIIPTNPNSSFYMNVYFGMKITYTLNEVYTGSGRKICNYINKYPNDYYKQYVGFYNNIEELRKAEYDLIHPHLNKDYCMNLKEGGGNAPLSEETKELISEKLKGKPRTTPSWNKGKHGYLSEECRKKLSKASSGKNNPMYGKNAEDYMTTEAIKEKRKKQSESVKGCKNGMWGIHVESLMTPEAIKEKRRKQSESMKGKNNWIKGKKHIHKGEIHIMVYPEQLENYLNNGYELGLPDSIKIKRLKFNK